MGQYEKQHKLNITKKHVLQNTFYDNIDIKYQCFKEHSMQVLFHLPTDLVHRFRQAVPSRQRSEFIRVLLEQSLPDINDEMYLLALEAQRDDDLNPTENWDATLMDGLDANESFDADKLEKLCQK